MTDLSRRAAEALDAALEALQRLTEHESWSTWLACLRMETETLCEALARRREKGEPLTLPSLSPDNIKRVVTENTLHGEGAAADAADDEGNTMDQLSRDDRPQPLWTL
jgi:hypothetical protein